jgi:excisionase family DNA binding protein
VDEQNEILNIGQLALYLKVPRSTLYKLVRGGEIPCHKVGRQWRFRKEAIHRWMDHAESPGNGTVVHSVEVAS